MSNNIFLDAPNLDKCEIKYLSKSINSSYVSTVGPYVTQFEKKIANFVKTKYAVATQSGTAALYMSLNEIGVKKGDEVIVPALTFIATANPILYCGAKPVIVDVDENTWNISPDAIIKAITSKTKAIIPVHLYGNPCDMYKINEIARKYKLYVIEDAAESLGATFNNKQTGSFGIMGCFSFNGNKILTTGGGGMIVTNSRRKANHIKYLINQARSHEDEFNHLEIGFNYRMTNLEASLGLAQFTKILKFIKKKLNIHNVYKNILSNNKTIKFQDENMNACSSWWINCIKINKNVDYIINKLRKMNIESRRIFIPLNKIKYLKKYSTNCINALDIYNNSICLPSSTTNTIYNIKKAANIINELLCKQLT
jgi:perosamine synthetase